MSLNTQPLSDKFGVAITGVDLSKELDEKLFNEMVDVFVKKRILVFRDQHIELNIKLPSVGSNDDAAIEHRPESFIPGNLL